MSTHRSFSWMAYDCVCHIDVFDLRACQWVSRKNQHDSDQITHTNKAAMDSAEGIFIYINIILFGNVFNTVYTCLSSNIIKLFNIDVSSSSSSSSSSQQHQTSSSNIIIVCFPQLSRVRSARPAINGRPPRIGSSLRSRNLRWHMIRHQS